LRIPSQAYNALLLRIPSAETKLGAASTEFPNSALTIPAPKKREDYPNVRFWFKHEWTEYLNERGTDMDAPRGKIKGVNRVVHSSHFRLLFGYFLFYFSITF